MERHPPPADGARPPTPQAIATWLLQRRPPDQPPDDLLAVAEAVYARLRVHLSNVLGALGFDALWTRAMHLAMRDDASGASARATAALTPGPPGLRELVLDADAAQAAALLHTILTHFLALLMTMIGAPLTLRLLRQLWPALPSGTAEAASDGKDHDHDRL